MSLLKSISTEINGRKAQVTFPDKKSIVLKGQNALHMLFVVESLLAQDLSGYYSEVDKKDGFNYGDIEGLSSLTFNDGAIFGKDNMCKAQGILPNIHVIRCLGTTFRSFYLSQELSGYSTVYNDMRHYSHIIQDAQWIRLLALVNNIVGFEMVSMKNGDLSFSFMDNYGISVEGQQIIYLLMAECFLTPDNYSRVLLIPNMSCLDNQTQIRFLEVLDDIKGHTLTLSTASIQPSELSESSCISFLNV